jgi:hypothetical protein
MKTLYYLSYIPTAPFWAVSWVLYGLALALCFVGDWIHDSTTRRIWNVLHARKCEAARAARKELP